MEFLLVFIPVLMSMSLALRDQYNRKNLVGSVMLTITSLLVIVRFCILAYFFDGGERGLLLTGLEYLSSMYIIPFCYMFLSDQCGTYWRNREALLMLSLPVLSLLSFIPALSPVSFRNWVVILQCLVIAFCMMRLWHRISQYQVNLTWQIKVYFAWIACLLLFTIISFALGMDKAIHDGNHWLFFIGFTMLITFGYLIVPYSFRVEQARSVVMPSLTSDESLAERDKFSRMNSHLADAMHKMMEEELYYLHPNINIDDVAQKLGTNRTYVTRLMRQEYGLSFIEYVNVARIQYSQKLLYTSPNITLEDVAFKSGFQSSSNYCRAFKRYTGTTPKGWLQQANR